MRISFSSVQRDLHQEIIPSANGLYVVPGIASFKYHPAAQAFFGIEFGTVYNTDPEVYAAIFVGRFDGPFTGIPPLPDSVRITSKDATGSKRLLRLRNSYVKYKDFVFAIEDELDSLEKAAAFYRKAVAEPLAENLLTLFIFRRQRSRIVNTGNSFTM